MSGYEDRLLDSAIREARSYSGYVTQDMYYTLMKYAKIGGQLGQGARDALATAKANNYNVFRGLTYRDPDEDTYARLGRASYY